MKFTWKKVIAVVFILSICLPFTLTTESKIKDFPVSIFSTYVENDNPADYKYTAFLPDITLIAKGWRKGESEGETTPYQKGERTVIVIHPPGDDGFYLFEPEK
ncbi:outer surface protein [Bacillus pseudomycoides]|uniref:Outer surface protein n=1 Tax=Bacillus pseudomycoides TaxID=64104 RepID=A0A2B4MEM6_9BACI|nr:outer surface protein [Bacillus pseudomycoides]PED09440.1 outer surface protein [Bacillus pseudomycoides]PEK27269.1 outer surface protein [Bacillus pseudomycoides]PEM59231.1 outer surface protein [Bacillus pseudomycoides]PEO08600.1 outer surface protein [Bacillus pseudomycoides]PEP63238.1 outer surface protein [Bacillus pseudomycoides]